jgi:hypothetical protein
VNGTDWLTPPPVAVIVTVVAAETALVVIENTPLREPAETVAVDGTEATAGLLLVSWNVWS